MASPQAIVEWFKGSSLQPFLSPLDAAAREKFLAAYGEKIAGAYKPRGRRQGVAEISAFVHRGCTMKFWFEPRAATRAAPTSGRLGAVGAPLVGAHSAIAREIAKSLFIMVALACSFLTSVAYADAAFQTFLQSLWPQAQALGVSRATFDQATRGLEPDLSLPDLVIPGRPQRTPGQAEFVETPADYLKEPAIQRLATQARKLYAQYRPSLTTIQRKLGVDPAILLAIYGRESDFGRARDSKSAIRVLATQAYVGKRKEKFQEEFVAGAENRRAGPHQACRYEEFMGRRHGPAAIPAVGLSEIRRRHRRRGYPDIWNSVPDALASAARQLLGEGWQPGLHWAYEVHPPANVDCTIGVPTHTLPLGEWLKHGYRAGVWTIHSGR